MSGAGQSGRGHTVESGNACDLREVLHSPGSGRFVKNDLLTLGNSSERGMISQVKTSQRIARFKKWEEEKDAHTDMDSCESACASENPFGPCIHFGQSMSGASDDLLQKETKLSVSVSWM